MGPRDAARKLCEEVLLVVEDQEHGGSGNVYEDLRVLGLANVLLDVARELECRYRMRAFPLDRAVP